MEERVERPCRRVRNICILAHVDHGKTTLADFLIAGGGAGLLHAKQAGKIRYLDSRDDEQQRAITMKSSSIALCFAGHAINLIDSPGHVDFCGEVSTAARLSDGALLLVDAVEGVHIQTHAVLRQAWIERLTPCLVLNKIDRLITELKMTPSEAYARFQSIIMEVNNIISTFRSEKYLSDVDSILAGPSTTESDGRFENEDEDEEDAFSPARGNVVFASALDGWAFRIDQFADLYAAKLGASQAALKKALWGDHCYNPKTKKIMGKKASAGKGKPMFVQFVLEPLWQVYDAAMKGSQGGDGGGQEMLTKIVKSMGLVVPPRDLQSKDPRVVIQSVMSKWLPLPATIFSMVIDSLPDPASAQSNRISRLMPPRLNVLDGAADEGSFKGKLDFVRRCVELCDESVDSPCVAFVSKMLAVPLDMLPRRGPDGELLNAPSAEDMDTSHGECFLAFARVFSGVLFTGQRLFILSPLYDPTKPEPSHIQEAVVHGLYVMMGQGLEPKSSVSAGNLVAIQGLGQQILKSATVSSTPLCWPFSSMTYQAAPIMRVAVEVSDPADMEALAQGLRLLNRADPFVEVSIAPTGEHVIAAAGEVHLERCVKDLKERFARVELEVSAPLVAFRETIETETPAPSSSLLSSDAPPRPPIHPGDGIVERMTPNGRCLVQVHVMRLPVGITEVIDKNEDLLRDVMEERSSHHAKEVDNRVPVFTNTILAKNEDGGGGIPWRGKLAGIWALGPRRVGPNLLLLPDNSRVGVEALQGRLGASSSSQVALVNGSAIISERLGLFEPLSGGQSQQGVVDKSCDENLSKEAESLETSVVSGFQLATASGPLCEEPMWGLAFTIEAWISHREKGGGLSSFENGDVEKYGPFSGQVMTAVKDACRAAVLSKHPRLVEAMYFCEVSTTSDHLGQMYAVLGRRRARILKEEMREGSTLFTVHAYVPVAESFGFSDELRRKTSGAASPQLVLSHWEVIEEDPFFVPRTEEELEEFGDGSSVPINTARKLIDAVRRRKGLPVEDKVVQHATKQRTLARKV